MGTLQTLQYNSLVNKLFQLLAKREFKQAEYLLITSTEHIFSKAKKGNIVEQDILFIQDIYSNFNQLYFNWLEEQHMDIEKEIDDLTSVEHDNFLISQCNDPAAVDDLMFELITYITGRNETEQQAEVTYHLNCYKKYLSA